MAENGEYTIHNDYDKIIRAINDLKEIDEETAKKLLGFVSKIKAIDNKLKPTMIPFFKQRGIEVKMNKSFGKHTKTSKEKNWQSST